ncbi:helix-turn-helix domain-containing protein [Streptomyces sp. NPDC058409]|uniref:helix-turn-helix domain-containing protein n=1 Tax=Streptomyces sp. NPDC058409 TaxID=3346484 RepID=UPI002253BE15|nr:helix-turn-helix domain-containing protein [Streptomyces atratus]MCX5340304.1 helix-turn-helix domain-containing protein [Streptomyces atratus]
MVSDGTPEGKRTLASKLDYLFETVRPRGRAAYTHEEVATEIAKRGGPTVSASYIWSLRTGKKDNPTMRHLEALADFFGVPPSYFFSAEDSERVESELALLTAFRDAEVRGVALRSSGLSSETLQTIRGFVERARALEGLSDED